MSDPKNQRADGCSVFFTFLVLALLLSGFYLAQRIFEPDAPASVTVAVDSARQEKAQFHREQDNSYKSKIDGFHEETNSSLETSMKRVIKNYNNSANPEPNPSN